VTKNRFKGKRTISNGVEEEI